MHSSHMLSIHAKSMLVPDVECFKRDKIRFAADLRARTCRIQDSHQQVQHDVRIESCAHQHAAQTADAPVLAQDWCIK